MSRVEEMYEMRTSGKSLMEIGKHYGVSRERVRQLLDRTYGSSLATEARIAREKRRTDALDAYRKYVIDALQRDPVCLTAKDIVDGSPVPITSAVELLQDQYWLLLARRHSPTRYDEKAIDEAIVRVWHSSGIHPGPLSRADYDRFRDKKNDPSGSRICQVMRWREACDRVGVPSGVVRRETYPSPTTLEQAVDWIVKYIKTLPANSKISSDGYGRWAAKTVGAPSLSTIINIDAGVKWNDLRSRAISKVASDDVATDPEPVVMRTVTDESIEGWVHQHRSGESARSIAAESGVSPSTVSRYLRKAGEEES